MPSLVTAYARRNKKGIRKKDVKFTKNRGKHTACPGFLTDEREKGQFCLQEGIL